jgi:1-acyl-sn-glycerol-3-phosphate acyltransferase
MQAAGGWWLRRVTTIRVEGLTNVPERGPVILVPNHQSAIDPILVQSICRRVVHTMTKSTQFGTLLFRVPLRLARTFPVRRYRVDPQSVRVFLRLLRAGQAVCLYPEGERTWDGRLQPLRRGAVRVILRAEVPVVPVGIEGTYDVWPRWASGPRKGKTVYLRFGAPMSFEACRTRAEREAAVAGAEEALRAALLALSGEASRGEGRAEWAGRRPGVMSELRGGGADPR